MSSILALLFLSGIFAFIHTVSGSNEIECEVTKIEGKGKGHEHFYYLMNRQSALEISQILTESLFLKNYMETETAKKSTDPEADFGKETKQLFDTLEKIRKNYYEKGNLAGNWSARYLKLFKFYTLDGYINVILKNLANSKNGLKWIHDRVEYDRHHICSQKLAERKQSPGINFPAYLNELEKKFAALCDMSQKMIAENYAFSARVYEKEKKNLEIESIGNDNATKSKMRKKLRKKFIGLYLHNLLRYALSFVLKPGKGVSYTDYENDATKEGQYLTYWLMTMMKQIGISSELNGNEMLRYMKINSEAGHIHVHLKKEELQKDESSQHHSSSGSGGISHGNGQVKIHANSIGHGHQDGTASAHSQQGTDGFNASSYIALSELVMQTDANSIADISNGNYNDDGNGHGHSGHDHGGNVEGFGHPAEGGDNGEK